MYNLISIKDHSRTVEVLKIVLGALAMAASAQVSIPLKPVSITLQTMVVMAIGLTYNRQSSFYTMVLYLLFGAFGLPVFTGWKAGLLVFTGPTGGYLVGMLSASYLMPYLRERFAIADLYNCLLSSLVIYLCGIPWLSTFIGFEAALYSGFLVYIPTGIAKALLLVGILRLIRRM